MIAGPPLPMDTLRKPFFIAAIVLLLMTVSLEAGSVWFLQAAGSSVSSDAIDGITSSGMSAAAGKGYETDRSTAAGVVSLSCLDGLLLFTVLLMAAQFVVGPKVQARVQGGLTLFVALSTLGAAIAAIFALIAKLLLMICFLLAIPFGTLIYLIIWGNFDAGRASAVLSTLLAFKLGALVCLILAHQRFMENKGLLLIFGTSIAANFVVSILHALVPRFLMNITDAIAGIVVLILGVAWGVVMLAGGIVSIRRALA